MNDIFKLNLLDSLAVKKKSIMSLMDDYSYIKAISMKI